MSHMKKKPPEGTLRTLAEMIQRSIAEAVAAEEAKPSEWKTPKAYQESLSITREKIRQANAR